MLARSLLYVAALLLAITSFSACSQQDKPAEGQTPPAEGAEPSEGEVDMAGQFQSIDETLRRAGWHAKRSNQEAAPLFSDVATLLTEYAATASASVKEDLQYSASELTGLSERIYSGPPITAKEVNVANAYTYWALAAYHQEQAAQTWPDGNLQETTMHLDAIANFIYAASGYAGGPVRTPGRSLSQKTKDLVAQLEGEPAPASDAVSQQIQEIGQEIRQLSTRLKQFLARTTIS